MVETIEEKKERAVDQVLEDLQGWGLADSKKILEEVLKVKGEQK